MTLLGSSLIFLAAAVVAVPLFTRLRLGAILGYLVAGVVIGPSVMNWVDDPDTLLHFAELGVVLLLFVIGLELEPEKLWRMRNQILATGGGQLVLCALAIGIIGLLWVGTGISQAVVIGLALALSSTAFAIQLMSEQGILKTPPGQQGFSILLMQDLAVIPILLLVASLAPDAASGGPAWWVSVGAIAVVLLVGKFLLNPFLRLVTTYGNQELMTAAALLIVIATALGMQSAGLSMGMGAFIAGILLANSSFRHQLETEIAPFKGLLLGLFFIAIGMKLDLQLLWSQPVLLIGAAFGLVALKTALIFALLRLARQTSTDSMRVALMLSQGGEFAFVVMSQASVTGLIATELSNQITLVVGLSMALTSPLVILYSLWFNSRNCPAVYDTHSETDEPQVIIAGTGRFGQITARILSANGIAFTALDKDSEHIEFLKQFGNRVFFGDACRLDLLKNAGIESARVLLIAVDKDEDGLKIAELVTHYFPHIHIIARAHNRMSVRDYAALGVYASVREIFESSVTAAQSVLQAYGYGEQQAQHMVNLFAEHDRSRLQESLDKNMDMQEIIASSKESREQLESLFTADRDELAKK